MQMGFLLGNIAAPIILSTTGNVLVLISIIPIELIILWWLGWHRVKASVRLPRLLFAVLVANLVTAIVGIPLGFNAQFAGSAGTAFFFLPIALILSIVIEWAVYSAFAKLGQWSISKRRLFLSIVLANLASYLLFFLFLSTQTYSPQTYASFLWKGNPKFVNRLFGRAALLEDIQSHLDQQKDFYRQHGRFSLAISQADLPQYQTSRSLRSQVRQFYQFEWSAQADYAALMAKPREAGLNSYTAVIFAVKQPAQTVFVEGICQADQPSLEPPPLPKRLKQTLQCAEGSALAQRWKL
jgi:hypothetical protein